MKKRDYKNLNKIKAVIFDVGGVFALKDINSKGVHYEIANSLKISLDTWIDSIDSILNNSIEGKLNYKETLLQISNKLSISEDYLEKVIKNVYKKIFKNNNYLFKQAAKLKKNGYKVAILSDQWAFSKEVLISKEFYQLFNPIILSCDVKIRKPNIKIYNLILNKLKLKPYETVFIDDRTWNLSTAEKIGMKTILFKSNKQLFEHPLWKTFFLKNKNDS